MVGGVVTGVVVGVVGGVVAGGAVGGGVVIGGAGSVADDVVDGSVVRVVVEGTAASVGGTITKVVDEVGAALVVALGPLATVIGVESAALDRVIVSEHALPSSMPAEIEGMYSSCASVRFMPV